MMPRSSMTQAPAIPARVAMQAVMAVVPMPARATRA
jgi:hypothetical protein